MRVGLLAHWPASDPESSGVESLAGAERVGFEALWLAPQTVADDGVLLQAAALAQRTDRIRLGIVGAPPPSLHPLRLAEDLAMLDLVSGGRLDWIPIADSAARVAEVAETIEIVLRAWRGEAFAHAGRHHAFPELVCLPRPHQSPHPPVWLPSGSARPSAAEAPALGHWIDGREDRSERADASAPRVLICTLAGDAAAEASRRRVSWDGATPRAGHAPISLRGDRTRGLAELSRRLDEASPEWLIVASPPDAPVDEAGLAEWFAFVAEAGAR